MRSLILASLLLAGCEGLLPAPGTLGGMCRMPNGSCVEGLRCKKWKTWAAIGYTCEPDVDYKLGIETNEN